MMKVTNAEFTIKIEVTPEGVALSGSNGQISIENFISIKDENAGILFTLSHQHNE